MLVLNRKIGEKIKIGHDIELIVLSINKHGQAQIGVVAPKDVKVIRKELLFRRKPSNENQ